MILLWVWLVSLRVVQEVLLVESLRATPRVVLPEKDRLIVDELAARRGDDLPSELFALQEVKEVKTHRIL